MDTEHVRIAIEALMREEIVLQLYANRFYEILSHTDEETRTVFGIPPGNLAADIVVKPSQGKAIVAEVKGTDVSHAVEQLKATGPYVKRKGYPFVEYKIFVRNATPPGDSCDLRGGEGAEGRLGYRAIRILLRDFPGEWALWSYATRDYVQIDGVTVSVIFGPYANAGR